MSLFIEKATKVQRRKPTARAQRASYGSLQDWRHLLRWSLPMAPPSLGHSNFMVCTFIHEKDVNYCINSFLYRLHIDMVTFVKKKYIYSI